jgi:hypothetical protein
VSPNYSTEKLERLSVCLEAIELNFSGAIELNFTGQIYSIFTLLQATPTVGEYDRPVYTFLSSVTTRLVINVE